MARILMIIDKYNKNIEVIANDIKKKFVTHSVLIKRADDVENINFNNFDIVYPINWPIHNYIKSKINMRSKKYRTLTTILNSHGRGNPASMYYLLRYYDGVGTSNLPLYNEFKEEYGDKIFYTPFGVDSEIFVPKTKPSDYSSIFGWVGNKTKQYKRYDEIKKVFVRLKYLYGDKYFLKTIDERNNLTQDELVDFYNSVGTIISFSESAGTSNSILEAASCGRAILSTNVGIVPQINKRCDGILVVNNTSDLKNSIIKLEKRGDILDHKGQVLREHVGRNLCWSTKDQVFLDFFNIENF